MKTSSLSEFILLSASLMDLLVDIQRAYSFNKIYCNQYYQKLLIDCYAHWTLEGEKGKLNFSSLLRSEIQRIAGMNCLTLNNGFCTFYNVEDDSIALYCDDKAVWEIVNDG